jgi:zinc finger protein BrlA
MYEPSKDHADDPNCLWMCTDAPECEDSATFLSRYGSNALNTPNTSELIISNGWQMLADPNTTPTVRTSFSGTIFPDEWQMLTDLSSNPSFSRGIFDEHQESSANCLNDNVVDWMPTVLQTPPQTVAPSAMFQTTLAPSPVHLIDPSTPQRFVRPASSILSSSPCPLYSPGQFSSQHTYDTSEDMSEEVGGTPRHAFKVKRHTSRVNQSCHHPRHVGSANRLKSGPTKSGMDCDVVIEGNKYACEFQDCVDKNGKLRMFKRREHAKRHVETVHKKRNQFKCWVPECATPPFTRNDNLKMHKKTHLKRSGKNRYVATLDPSSTFYDPEYEGPLDEDGNPTQ